MAETEKEPELLAALLCRQPVRAPSGQISALRLEARLEVAIGIVQRILDLVRHGTHSHPADLGEVLGNSIPPWARNHALATPRLAVEASISSFLSVQHLQLAEVLDYF
jgi:hypothetical protein